MAKDFKKQITRPSVYSTLSGYTQDEQKVLTAPTAQTAQDAPKTPRINMAFTPENYAYIRTMSKIKGQTLTKYVNEVIERERQEAGDVYEKAQELIRSL